MCNNNWVTTVDDDPNIYRGNTKLVLTFLNNAQIENHVDLDLGKVVYQYISNIYHIPDPDFLYWMAMIFIFDGMTV